MAPVEMNGNGARSETAEPEKPNEDSKLPKPEELWAMAMKVIEAENALVNHRLTWFLGIQAFLGVALGLVVGNSRFESVQTPAIFMIALFGWGFVMVNAPGIQAARRQITAADSWLKKSRLNAEYVKRCPYPPPKGIRAEIRIFGRRITDLPIGDSYDPIYEFTEQETQPDYTQFGFANFPDVIFVFWAVVMVWAGVSELTGVAGKPPPTVLTVPAMGLVNPSIAVTDPNTGVTIARISMGEASQKRAIMIELPSPKPASGK